MPRQRQGWLGLPSFAERLRGAAHREPDAPDGLVLAGGGARASFQIGSLRYLYDHTDFAAPVITGTSAGSILGAMLAQSATHDGQRDGVDKLEEIWRSLHRQSDMFAERRWYRTLQSYGPELQELLPVPPAGHEEPEPLEPPASGRRGWFSPAKPPPEPDEQPVGPDQHFHPLLGFQPEQEDDSGRFRLTQLWQLLPQVGTLSRASGDLPAVIRGAERTRALYRPGPILRQLLSPGTFDPARVTQSGVRLRMATVCLETGQVRYLREDGLVVDRDDVPLDDVPAQDLVMGVLASCSIPGVFTPVPLGDEHYIDGGVRENLPVEMAIGHLGLRRPYCLVSSPSGVSAQQDADRTLFSILQRTSEIMTDELQRDEVAYARSAGAVVIEPEFSVHDAMTVDPGLIAINMDYGWLRAAEVIGELGADVVRLNRDLIVARTRSWALENSLDGPDELPVGPERAAAALELETQRATVRRLVGLAAPSNLPDGAATWGARPERHAWTADDATA